MDFRDFLVMLHILYMVLGWQPAPPLCFLGCFDFDLLIKLIGHPKKSLWLIWFPLVGALGGVNFCSYKPPCKSLNKTISIMQILHTEFLG